MSEINAVLREANATLLSCVATLRKLSSEPIRDAAEVRTDLGGAIDAARQVQGAFAILAGFDEFTQARIRRMNAELAAAIGNMEAAYVRLAAEQQYQGA